MTTNGRLQMLSTNTSCTPMLNLCQNASLPVSVSIFCFKKYVIGDLEYHKTILSKKRNAQKLSADGTEGNQLHDCTMTGPRSVVQQLYIAQHGRQEIDIKCRTHPTVKGRLNAVPEPLEDHPGFANTTLLFQTAALSTNPNDICYYMLPCPHPTHTHTHTNTIQAQQMK